MAAKKTNRFGVIEVVHEVRVAASSSKVWKALTGDIGKWWPKAFHTRPDTKRFVLEAEVGGRVYEDAGHGEGLLWFTVVGVEEERRLLLSGELFPAFGGPARLQTTFELRPEGDATVIRLSDVAWGRVDAALKKSLASGWKTLLETGLKPFAEGPKPRLDIPLLGPVTSFGGPPEAGAV